MTADDETVDPQDLAPEALSSPPPTVVQVGDDQITLVDSEDDAKELRDESGADDTPADEAIVQAGNSAVSEDTMRQRESWYLQEVHKAQESSRTSQLQAAELAKETLQFQLTASVEALKHARDARDSGQQVDLERQIRGIEGQQAQLNGIMDQLKRPIPAPQPQTQARQVAPGMNASSALAARYAEGNAWMRDPKHAPELQYFLAVDRQLAQQGLGSDNPRHFTELTQRVAKAFPNLQIKDLDGKTPKMIERQRGAGARTPVASARGANNADARNRQPAQNKALGPIQLAMLKALGRDPKDPKVQAVWNKVKGGRA